MNQEIQILRAVFFLEIFPILRRISMGSNGVDGSTGVLGLDKLLCALIV